MRKVKVLKPSKEGLIVINPQTKLPIKKDGEPLVMSTYWARCLKSGDVVEVVKKEDSNKKQSKIKKSEE